MNKILSSLAFFSILLSAAYANDVTWKVTSGNWDVANNWNPAAVPSGKTATDWIRLTNGISGTPATTFYNKNSPIDIGNLVIGSFNTLTFNTSGGSLVSFAPINNSGIIQSTTTAATLDIRGGLTNSGTIQAASGSTLTFTPSSNITNTGTFLAKTGGGVLQFANFTNLTGGRLETQSGGAIYFGATSQVNQTVTLSSVTFENSGTFANRQIAPSVNSGTRAVTTTLGASTTFTNHSGATASVLNAPSSPVPVTGGGSSFDSVLNVNSGATFNNQGTLQIQNDSTRTTSGSGTIVSQKSNFNVNSGTFSNTGTINVVNNSTSANATATFTSNVAIVNAGTLLIQGNSANAGASFTVSGASYTQSGSGQLTTLARGGVLAASSIAINSGALIGSGTVNGATTIGTDGTLAAGAPSHGIGALSFSSKALTIGGTVKFDLSTLSIYDQITAVNGLTLTGATLEVYLDSGLTELLAAAPEKTATFNLFTGTGFTGQNFSSIIFSGFDSESISSFSFNNGILTLTIPEPSSWLLCLTGMGGVFLIRRRLRRNI